LSRMGEKCKFKSPQEFFIIKIRHVMPDFPYQGIEIKIGISIMCLNGFGHIHYK
jgi:hypothetical protein